MILQDPIRPFVRRIRLLTIIRRASVGACVGGALSVGLAIADKLNWVNTHYSSALIAVGCGAILGAFAGFLYRPVRRDVLQSIDRRGNLKDRLDASNANTDSTYISDLHQDSTQAVQQLSPSQVYPFRIQKEWFIAIGLVLVAIAGFWFTRTAPFASSTQKEEKKEMRAESERLANLKKAIFKEPEPMTSPEIKKLERKLEELQKDLEKANLEAKAALQKKEDLKKQTDELADQKFDLTQDALKEAESIREKMEEEFLKDEGMSEVNRNDLQLSDAELDQKIAEAKQKAEQAEKAQNEIQKQMDSLALKMNQPGLSEKEKSELQKQMQESQKAMSEAKKSAEQAKKQMANFQLSKEAKDALNKMMNDPLMKEIREAAAKLQQKSGSKQAGKKPELTKEQIEELRKKIEDFLKKMQDEDARKKYLEAMLKALKEAKEMGQCNGLGLGLGLGMGIGGPGPGPDNDTMLMDSGLVNKSDPIQGKGKGNPTFAPTQRDDTRPGEEMTFMIKAPTFKNSKTSVPYKKILPGYQQKAEKALRQKQIPKEQQERVKRYFESLKK